MFRGVGKTKKSYPAINLTKKDPQLAAMVSKMEYGRNSTVAHDPDGNRKALLQNTYAFRTMLQKRAKRNSDSAAIMKLLPDIELSAQIVTSSILSPKDMMTMELIYNGPKSLLSSELTSAMLNRIKEHFEDGYRITDYLAEMVREPLFEKGAYPIAVIPENAIDEMINGQRRVSMEELNVHFNADGKARGLGILGPHIGEGKVRKIGPAFEGYSAVGAKTIDPHVHYFELINDGTYAKEDYLVVTDNPNVLKVANLNRLAKEKEIHRAYKNGKLEMGMNHALEAYQTGISDRDVESAIYRTRQHHSEPVATLKHQHSLNRKSVGNPLIMKLPSESVLPVHVPGNPKKHIGYFIMLDEEGNPVSAPEGEQMHPGLRNDSTNSVGSSLIKKVGMNMGTNGDQFDPLNQVHMDFAQQLYADMVERDLISRVKNGVYSDAVTIARNEEVYRLMLSRVLAKKYTQVLYIPIEYMTYIAFKHGDDGIGRSMMDDQAMINVLRSVLLFSDIMSSVKNSIGRTKVTGNIPENDPNPMKTMEMVMDEIVRSRTLGIPLGVSNPADVMEFIQRAGYEWELGGHKSLPDLKFEFQQTQTSYAKPDQDLTDHLRKSSIMGFGLSPETVDNGFNSEFATTAVANNILLSKRVVMWQDIFTPQLTDLMRKIILNTESVINDLKEILTSNMAGINLDIEDVDGTSGTSMDEELKKKIIVSRALTEFVRTFKVSLPRPSSVTLEAQVSELKTYADALDVALEAYITSDMFVESVVGELANEANTVKSMCKAYFLRKWMADKNILPELAALVTADEDGQPQLLLTEEIKRHIEAMTKAGVMTLVSLQPNKKAADADLESSGVTVGENSDTGGMGGGGGGSSGGDSSGGGDDFGMGDFGGGDLGDMGDLGGSSDDLGAGDEPTEEEPATDLDATTNEEPKEPEAGL